MYYALTTANDLGTIGQAYGGDNIRKLLSNQNGFESIVPSVDLSSSCTKIS